VKAFFSIINDDSFEAGSQALMQISGLGKLRPNMVLMGYKGNWRTCDPEELMQYFNVIQYVSVCVLYYLYQKMYPSSLTTLE
jgi:solute carrier family 12 sodium/potassium/chloride transporter 2